MKIRAFLLALLVAGVACAQVATIGVNLNYTPPTLNMDGTPITGALTYNVYQGPKGGAFAKVASGLTGTSTVIASTAAGSCFAVTAVEQGGSESPLSNTACTLQPAAPGALTVVVTVTVK